MSTPQNQTTAASRFLKSRREEHPITLPFFLTREDRLTFPEIATGGTRAAFGWAGLGYGPPHVS